MTKAQLAAKMAEFIEAERDDYDDEWYCSPRDIAASVLEKFAKSINVPLVVEEVA